MRKDGKEKRNAAVGHLGAREDDVGLRPTSLAPRQLRDGQHLPLGRLVRPSSPGPPGPAAVLAKGRVVEAVDEELQLGAVEVERHLLPQREDLVGKGGLEGGRQLVGVERQPRGPGLLDDGVEPHGHAGQGDVGPRLEDRHGHHLVELKRPALALQLVQPQLVFRHFRVRAGEEDPRPNGHVDGRVRFGDFHAELAGGNAQEVERVDRHVDAVGERQFGLRGRPNLESECFGSHVLRVVLLSGNNVVRADETRCCPELVVALAKTPSAVHFVRKRYRTAVRRLLCPWSQGLVRFNPKKTNFAIKF